MHWTRSANLPLSPHVVALAAGALGWAALLVSLEMGRTTPATVSRGWLALFMGASAAVLVWEAILGLLLHKVVGLGRESATQRVAASAAPLLLAMPCLLGLYLSDQVYHYLFSNSIPRALAVGAPALATLMGQVGVLVWSIPPRGRAAAWLSDSRATPAAIFTAFALLYLFTAGGHLYSADERYMFLVTQSVAERGSLAIPRWDQIVPDDPSSYQYSKYGLVPSLVGVPLYGFSGLVGWEPEAPSAAFPLHKDAPPLIPLLVGPLATAATCALLYSLARELGFRAAASLGMVVAYGLGTSAWVYSKTFFSQPLATLFFLGAVYLLAARDRPSPGSCALAGSLLGLAAGSRAEMMLLAAPLLLLLAGRARRDPVGSRRRGAAFAVAFLAVAGTVLGAYNLAKTGSLLETGHGTQGTMAGFAAEPLIGLFGTLLSPGFGFFVYNPLALLGIVALPRLGRRRPAEACLFGGLLALAWLFYGSFGDWSGGIAWANRYLMVVLPFAVLPAVALMERPFRNGLSLALLGGAAALGMGVNLLAVLFDFNNGWLNLWDHGANLDLAMWDPRYSPIFAHLRLLRDFLLSGAKLDLYLYHKLGIPSLLVFGLVFAALASLAIRTALLSDLTLEKAPAGGGTRDSRRGSAGGACAG